MLPPVYLQTVSKPNDYLQIKMALGKIVAFKFLTKQKLLDFFRFCICTFILKYKII